MSAVGNPRKGFSTLGYNNQLRLKKIADGWNRTHQVGAPVHYRDDFGNLHGTYTRSAAGVRGSHTAVIWIDSKSGCVALERVTQRPHRIITTAVFPPIPVRTFDWQAHYDGEEDEQMDVGSGPTKEAAVLDLIDNYPRPDVFCPERGR